MAGSVCRPVIQPRLRSTIAWPSYHVGDPAATIQQQGILGQAHDPRGGFSAKVRSWSCARENPLRISHNP